jgi:hypothetical protein
MGCEWRAGRAWKNGIKISPFGSKNRLCPKLFSLLQIGFKGAGSHFPLYLQGFCCGRKGVFRACILYVRFKHVFSKACYDAAMIVKKTRMEDGGWRMEKAGEMSGEQYLCANA